MLEIAEKLKEIAARGIAQAEAAHGEAGWLAEKWQLVKQRVADAEAEALALAEEARRCQNIWQEILNRANRATAENAFDQLPALVGELLEEAARRKAAVLEAVAQLADAPTFDALIEETKDGDIGERQDGATAGGVGKGL